MKENCKINNESDNYRDAEEEINEYEELLPQNEEVKKAYEDENNALSENFIGLENAIKVPGNALIDESNVSEGKNNPAGSAEIDYSHSSNEIGMYFSKVHNMKDFEEMNPNTEVELGKASETRKK